MTKESDARETEVFDFIRERIESVPHLEALLLVWKTRPQVWSVPDLAARLYIDEDGARMLLEDLSREGLIVAAPSADGFRYQDQSENTDALMKSLDQTYRHQLIRISNMIHSKASTALRDFARAFRVTKERK
jgi:predicted ArsR family transcriptional regulator